MSAEVLQREQQELRSQESSTKLLEGRVETVPEQQQQLSLLSDALSGVRAQLENVPAEQQPDLLLVPCVGSLNFKYDISKRQFQSNASEIMGRARGFFSICPSCQRKQIGTERAPGTSGAGGSSSSESCDPACFCVTSAFRG